MPIERGLLPALAPEYMLVYWQKNFVWETKFQYSEVLTDSKKHAARKIFCEIELDSHYSHQSRIVKEKHT